MARIGAFRASKDGFTGSIKTLKLDVPKVEFRSIDGDPAKDQPVYRLYAEGAEIGSAWRYTSDKGVEFLSVSLDDPSFPGPINAKLFAAKTGFDLVWTRPVKRDADKRPQAEPDDEA
ncbi:DUF736 domain-containing protein [Caulobacter flavus]|uniref:DUF736 domain-containing protein n=1 Tax=Caulobacter flavus TaxID=1679497 RepID=A0A2N5CP01_9CAUL|nr:DUF736 domain-containing protein [Caulobacter flavus]AYV48620.1 DUF736 domain-containing protein [Caulobacter flavus]PLR08664.1 DUF736 domain-containing protein [Caulobacter flavus]